MNDNFQPSGALSAYHKQANGLYLHQGLLGDVEKFTDDVSNVAKTLYQTALHVLHVDATGSKILANLQAEGATPHEAAAAIPVENIKAAHHLGPGVITTTGVTALAADWTNATATLKLANFHDSGTGATAAAIGNTTMQTPTGNARVSGAQTNPSAGVYQTVATLPYAGPFAITEWGLFLTLTVGTMWDHKVFGVINVLAGDSTQYTYQLTCPAGG